MATHAKLQPSKAKTWLNCPGSITLSENVVDTAGQYADEGTACHELCERALNGEDIEKLVGEKAQIGLIFTEEMVALAKPNIEWVRDYQDATGAVLHLEQKVEIGTVLGLPEGICFGTSDVVALTKDEIGVFDHKFGYNAVEVRDNEQLICYAIGSLAKFSPKVQGPGDIARLPKRVRLAILQPKCGEPSEHVYTVEEIVEKIREFTPKAQAAHKGGPLVPSDDACRWCKAKPVCPALRDEMYALARMEFAANALTLSPEELSDLLLKLEMLEPAATAIRNHALKLLDLGTEIPGWKRVRGDTKRAWLQDEKATAAGLKKLGVDPYEKKLVSPAGAEAQIVEALVGKGKEKNKTAAKKTAKEILKKLAGKPEGRPTLAKSTDPREALPPAFTHEDIAALEAAEGID